MNITILESLRIKLSDFKILDVLLFELFQPPNECCFVCSRHIMSNSLEFSVRFNSRMFQEISINRRNFVRLAYLHRNFVEITDDSLYSASSINHCKMRLWVSFLPHSSKEDSIIFQSFLEDVFRCENISGDPILCYKDSPLSIRTFLSEESSI